MRRALFIIFAAIAPLLSSCNKKSIIPKNTMSEIIVDMYMLDQYFSFNPMDRNMADSVNVYEGIFERYGYSSDIFQNSITHYLQKPDRLAKIYRKSKSKFETKREVLIELSNKRSVTRSAEINTVLNSSIKDLADYHYHRNLKWILSPDLIVPWTPIVKDAFFDTPQNSQWWIKNLFFLDHKYPINPYKEKEVKIINKRSRGRGTAREAREVIDLPKPSEF